MDIGFALLPRFEGQGYAYEASVRIRDAAFRDFNLEKVYAITAVENKASQRLLDKLGMIFQKMMKLPNDDEAIMLYRLTQEDFVNL